MALMSRGKDLMPRVTLSVHGTLGRNFKDMPWPPTTGVHSSACTCLGYGKNGNCSPWDKLQSGAMAETAASQQTCLIYLEVVPPRDNHKWRWWDLFSFEKLCPQSCMNFKWGLPSDY